ncbi:MAG: adenylosuccinate synthase [Oligoflexales bacterium]
MAANVNVLIGAQWGDEGKGKWIDILADQSDIIARYQGGNNAGHTLVVEGQKVVLHQIPSAIFHNKISALTAGVVVNPGELVTEMNKVAKIATELGPQNLWMSPRCHVITPWNIFLDETSETKSANPIGTTKRGIGPTYSEKILRSGIRLGEYVDDALRQKWFDSMCRENERFLEFTRSHPEKWETFHASARNLKPFVCDAEHKIREAITKNRKVLLEGAQGALLDIDHGTYPYVTSSHTGLGGAISGIGFSPFAIGRIMGVAKAYSTRVGHGPFPTELTDSVGDHLSSKGNEFGATTGRKRRCGWIDIVSLRYSCQLNGMTELVLNKLDILSGLKEIKIATQYRNKDGETLSHFPWDIQYQAYTPVYETMPGWSADIENVTKFENLPNEAKRYIERVEQLLGIPVTMVGVGPARAHSIFLNRK